MWQWWRSRVSATSHPARRRSARAPRTRAQTPQRNAAPTRLRRGELGARARPSGPAHARRTSHQAGVGLRVGDGPTPREAARSVRAQGSTCARAESRGFSWPSCTRCPRRRRGTGPYAGADLQRRARAPVPTRRRARDASIGRERARQHDRGAEARDDAEGPARLAGNEVARSGSARRRSPRRFRLPTPPPSIGSAGNGDGGNGEGGRKGSNGLNDRADTCLNSSLKNGSAAARRGLAEPQSRREEES